FSVSASAQRELAAEGDCKHNLAAESDSPITSYGRQGHTCHVVKADHLLHPRDGHTKQTAIQKKRAELLRRRHFFLPRVRHSQVRQPQTCPERRFGRWRAHPASQ